MSCQQTREQIAAERIQNEQVHASSLLKDLSLGTDDVREKLTSHASMFFEIEECMTKIEAKLETCWHGNYTFDPLALQKAWSHLDASIRAASPFLIMGEEDELLNQLAAIKKAHQSKITVMLPPKSAKEAQALRSAIMTTTQQLATTRDRLEQVVSQRVRSRR